MSVAANLDERYFEETNLQPERVEDIEGNELMMAASGVADYAFRPDDLTARFDPVDACELPFDDDQSGNGHNTKESLRQYLDEIGRYPLLNREDEVELAILIEAGKEAGAALEADGLSYYKRRKFLSKVQEGDRAFTAFYHSNLRLVVSIAGKYRSSGVPKLDLIQEGNFGLFRAVEKFDWRRGCKFSTYATWWIRQAMQRKIPDHSRTIRIPAAEYDLVNKAQKHRGILRDRFDREPTIEEIAEASGMLKEKVREVLSHPEVVLSINKPIGEDGSSFSLMETLPGSDPAPDEEVVARLPSDRAIVLMRTLDLLSEEERAVIMLRYGFLTDEPLSPYKTSIRLKIPVEKVNMIEQSVLERLREEAD